LLDSLLQERVLLKQQDAQLEIDWFETEVCEEHPEDHFFHEDGVSCQIC